MNIGLFDYSCHEYRTSALFIAMHTEQVCYSYSTHCILGRGWQLRLVVARNDKHVMSVFVPPRHVAARHPLSFPLARSRSNWTQSRVQNSNISSRVVNVVSRSEKLVRIASISSLVVARSDKQTRT